MEKKAEVVEILKKSLTKLLPEDMIKLSIEGIKIVRPKERWRIIAESNRIACKTISFSDFRKVAEITANTYGLRILKTDSSHLASVYKFVEI